MSATTAQHDSANEPDDRTAAPTAARTPSRRLSRRARHVVLIVHIVASVAWIGVNLAMLALVVAGLTSSDGQVVAVAQQAVTIIVPPVVPALAILTVGSGIVLGLGTRWGLLTHRWVVIKLVMSVVMLGLVFVALLPGALGAETPDPTLSADALRAQTDLGNMIFPPVVSGLALIVATVLSVTKPGGTTRWARTNSR